MTNNKDFDYIKNKFDSDELHAPESLSQDAMASMLKAADEETATSKTVREEAADKTVREEAADEVVREEANSEHTSEGTYVDVKSGSRSRKRWMRPLIAVAACAALALGLVPFMNSFGPGSDGSNADGDGTLTASADSLDYFDSYDQLDETIKKMVESEPQMLTHGVSKGLAMESTEDFALSDQAMSSNGSMASGQSAPASATAPDHSSTYTQVDGVDEADIVKTDGRYIYYLSYQENQLIIAKASKGKANRVAAINASKVGDYIHDIYVKGDKLIIIGSNLESGGTGKLSALNREYTTVTTFDISDRTAPEKIDQYSQTGYLLSSRMVGSNVILVTNDHIFTYVKNNCAPYICYGNDKPVKLGVEDICGIPDAGSPAFTVVSAIDTASGKVSKEKITTKAILGGSHEIYCSRDTLYVTASLANPGRLVTNGAVDFATDDGAASFATDGGAIPKTSIPENDMEMQVDEYLPKTCVLKVSLKNGKVNCENSATVEGILNNQFSMDDADGVFKIATTSTRKGQDVNNLFLFDEDMKELGSVRNFARDEHIEAVRYVKDKAYVITYEQTDPLFIIDLADPTDPKIEGHVKISGFSTLLVPAGENHLLGLGFSTETTEWGEATDGVKLALFDISDPSKPTVADSKSFAGMDSEVQYKHKALLVGPDTSYYAIPYERWSEKDERYIPGILKFSVQEGKLTNYKKMQTSDYVNRCIYIDNYIYGICQDDHIEGFKIK